MTWSQGNGGGTHGDVESSDWWRNACQEDVLSQVCSARTNNAHAARMKTSSHQLSCRQGQQGHHGGHGGHRSGDHGSGMGAAQSTRREQRNSAEAANRRHRWINRQITSAASKGEIAWFLQVVQAHLSGMNLINCSTALHRIAKLALSCNAEAREWIKEHESIRGLRAIASLDIERLWKAIIVNGTSAAKRGNAFAIASERQSEMRCLSIICWSCATLRVRDEILLERASEVTGARLAELKPFELSNLLWAFGKLSLGRDQGGFEDLAPHILQRREGQFGPQCLSTIVWAFGTAKVYHPAMFASIAAEIGVQAHAMTPHSIANTVWAFARVRRQEAPLFRVLAEAATSGLNFWSFKPQELSNMVWAFATVHLPHAPLFEKVAEVAVARRHELRPPNVANLLWAYAKLASPSRARLFPQLLEVAETSLEHYKPQEIAAILWAVGKEASCPTCRHLFYVVPQVFASRLRGFQSQALACTIEAFTLVDIEATDFFDAMLCESLGRLGEFQPPSMCTLFRGVALTAQRRAVTGGPSLVAQVRMLDEQISSRLSQLQSHNVLHLIQTLDLLPPAAQASWTPSLASSSTLRLRASAFLPLGGSASDRSADVPDASCAPYRVGGGSLAQSLMAQRVVLQDSCELEAPDADWVLSDCFGASGEPLASPVVQDTFQLVARHKPDQRHCGLGAAECTPVTLEKHWTPPPVLALAQSLGDRTCFGTWEAPTCSSTPAGSLRANCSSFLDSAEQREVQKYASEPASVYLMPPPGL